MATIPKKSLDPHKQSHSLLKRYAQIKRRRRPIEVKAPRPCHAPAPLPDEPDFNETTKQALRASRDRVGLIRSDDWDSFFAELGM